MKRKVITGIVLTLLFISVLTFAIRIKPVKAWTGGTIRILSSGSVTPEGAPLSSSPPYILYNVTEDIISTEAYPNSSIVVERDNIIIDGAGHTLQGSGTSGPNGIRLSGRTNVTVKGLEIKDLQTGVLIADSSNVTISGNNITNNWFGVLLDTESPHNTISGNNISTNTWGIYSYDADYNLISGNNIINNANHGVMIGNYSCHNTVSGNNITGNGEAGVGVGVLSDYNTISGNNIIANTQKGIYFLYSNSNVVSGNDISYNNNNGVTLNYSGDNVFCLNNFVNNTGMQVDSDALYANFWNSSYPGRGNYWSEQTHVGEWADRFSGPNQDDPAGPDGILDNDPYEIDLLNIDYLPLTHEWTPTITTVTKGQQQIQVCIDSNTSISTPTLSGQTLSFTASAVGTEGYVFIIIEWPPSGMPYIEINGVPPPTTPTAYHNGTHWFIYFEFPLSTHDITIYFPIGWPMFRHDLSHSGYSTSTAPNTNNTLWIYATGDWVYSSPAVVDDRVYIGSYDNKTYCINASDGTPIWNYTTGGWVHSSPAVADGKVYVGSWDNKVYCLNASAASMTPDEREIWNYTTGGNVYSSPAVADGKVYIGSHDDKVYCLNASDGTPIWNYTTGDNVHSSPAVTDGRVYIGSYDDKVYCLNASAASMTPDEREIWNYTTNGPVSSSPAVADGKVYIGSFDNKTYCINASDGTPIWNYTTGGWVLFSSPAVTDGKVYIGSYDDKVYCLNASAASMTPDEREIWNYTTGGNVYSSPAVADGKVYIGSVDKKVHCISASDGTPIWNYTTGYSVASSPAVADGRVYVGSNDGKVYAFGVCSVEITNVNVAKGGNLVNSGYKTWAVNVSVTIHNNGTIPTNCTVNAYYYNATVTQQIGTSQNVTNLDPCNTATLTFLWNLSGDTVCETYTVKANATTPGVTSDEYVDGQMTIRFIGDVNGDCIVDGGDQIQVGNALWTTPADPPCPPPPIPCYNVYADVNGDYAIDGGDQIVVGNNLWQGCPCPA